MKTSLAITVAVSASSLMLPRACGQDEQPKRTEAVTGATSETASTKASDGTVGSTSSDKVEEQTVNLMLLRGHDGMVNRRLAELLRFQATILETIKLSPEKRKSVEALFDDYMAALLSPDIRLNPLPGPDDMEPPQRLPALYREKFEAQKSGDSSAVARINRKINAANAVLEPSITDPTTGFVHAVAFELGKENEETLHKIVDRWEAFRIREVMPDNALKRLNRCFRDPDLEITKELRQEIMGMLIMAMRKMSFEERNDQRKTADAAESLRPKVHEKLTTEQRQHVEKTYAMLDKWSKGDPDAVRAARARLSNHKPRITPLSSRLKRLDRKQD